jgi:hypothetical protein
MCSRALERVTRWLQHQRDDPRLLWFRSVFGFIWLAYDVADLLVSGTATVGFWPAAVLGAPHALELLQLGLIVCEVAMIRGAFPRAAPLAAAALRGTVAYRFVRLNDFYYFIVIALLLSALPPGAPWRCRVPRVRSWVHDALRWQTAWIYLATGTLKLNDAWLSGAHLTVRHAYLANVVGWPYPRALVPYLTSPVVNAKAAWLAALAEIALGVLVAAGRPAAAAIALAAAIHAWGALATNVWFFGASMFAQVTLIVPRPHHRCARAA